MKHLSRKINKYKASTMYRDQVNNNLLGLALLGLAVLSTLFN